MTDNELLLDLLLKWEDHFEQGVDLSAENLCEDRPDLVAALARRIYALKKLAWIKTPVPRAVDETNKETTELFERFASVNGDEAVPRAADEIKEGTRTFPDFIGDRINGRPFLRRAMSSSGLDSVRGVSAMSDTTDLLKSFGEGDERARDELLRRATERLHRLASQMLRTYPRVRRWEQTDDVLQNAVIRLNRALSSVKSESSRHFWNLAVLQIRRELMDLADRYRASPDLGERHDTDDAGNAPDHPGGAFDRHSLRSNEPDSLEAWSQFHALVANLPEKERVVVDLKWYAGFTLVEIAQLLDVSLSTVGRRWKRALVLLGKAMGGDCPR